MIASVIPPTVVGVRERGLLCWDSFPVWPALQAPWAHCMDHWWPGAVDFLSSLCEA